MMSFALSALLVCVLSAQACDFADSDAGGEPVVLGPGAPRSADPATDASAEDAKGIGPTAQDSGTDVGAPNYPGSPYGFAVGDTVLDASFTDQDGAVLRLSSLRARSGVKVILWSSGAEWCGVCRLQASKLQALHETRANEGLLVVESLHQSVDGSPADAATLARWKNDVAVSYQLLAEKDPSYARQTSNPLELVIDAATMKILYRQQHATSDLGAQVDAALAEAEP